MRATFREGSGCCNATLVSLNAAPSPNLGVDVIHRSLQAHIGAAQPWRLVAIVCGLNVILSGGAHAIQTCDPANFSKCANAAAQAVCPRLMSRIGCLNWRSQALDRCAIAYDCPALQYCSGGTNS